MPAGNGTGPMGMGPMTGRAAGCCAGYSVPGYMNPLPGRGFGRGGWGRRNRFYATGMPWWARAAAGSWGGCGPYGGPPATSQELDVLKARAEYFGGALEDTRKRIEELEAGNKAERPAAG